MRRRLVFATPFVLAIACKRPVERGREPDPPIARDAAPVVDAPVDSPRDIDAHFMTAEEMRALCARPGVHCNPPPPSRDAAVDAPMPKLEGRVGGVKRGTGKQRTIVTIDIGARDGVLPSWTGTLVDGAATLGSFTIIQVNEGSTTGYTDAPYDRVSGQSRVRFSPPETK